MAQGMGSDVFSNAGETSVFFDNALDAAGGKPTVVAVRRGKTGVFRIV